MDEKLKGTVKHKLAMLPAYSMIRWITQQCILEHCEPDITTPWYAAHRLQLSIRCQYYRLASKNQSDAYKLTYFLNCPPSGFTVNPYTRLCNQHHVCPWCFARRVVKIYDAIMEPGAKTRNLQKLIVWQRQVPSTGKLPFFRANSGPHTWLDATVTAQIAVPYFDINTRSFRLKHVGFQLVPKQENNCTSKLTRNCINPALTFRAWHKVNSKSILAALKSTMQFPWLDLYTGENLEHFERLMNLYPKQQLLRISYYKPK